MPADPDRRARLIRRRRAAARANARHDDQRDAARAAMEARLCARRGQPLDPDDPPPATSAAGQP
ncbi:hypothetical protein GCM10027261_14160 [Geodermatophilus arenarius]